MTNRIKDFKAGDRIYLVASSDLGRVEIFKGGKSEEVLQNYDGGMVYCLGVVDTNTKIIGESELVVKVRL